MQCTKDELQSHTAIVYVKQNTPGLITEDASGRSDVLVPIETDFDSKDLEPVEKQNKN